MGTPTPSLRSGHPGGPGNLHSVSAPKVEWRCMTPRPVYSAHSWHLAHSVRRSGKGRRKRDGPGWKGASAERPGTAGEVFTGPQALSPGGATGAGWVETVAPACASSAAKNVLYAGCFVCMRLGRRRVRGIGGKPTFFSRARCNMENAQHCVFVKRGALVKTGTGLGNWRGRVVFFASY